MFGTKTVLRGGKIIPVGGMIGGDKPLGTTPLSDLLLKDQIGLNPIKKRTYNKRYSKHSNNWKVRPRSKTFKELCVRITPPVVSFEEFSAKMAAETPLFFLDSEEIAPKPVLEACDADESTSYSLFGNMSDEDLLEMFGSDSLEVFA
jgi:hypothetical protein